MTCNLWVLSGFLVFVIVEKLFCVEAPDDEDDGSVITKKQEAQDDAGMAAEKEMENNNCITLCANNLKNGFSKRSDKADYSKDIEEVTDTILFRLRPSS